MNVKSLFNEAYEAGRSVQTREHAGEVVDGKQVWQELETKTGELKNKDLTDMAGEKIKYNSDLENIYIKMDEIISKFKMDESEFDPKSNHFFCQLKNLVKSKSNFNVQLNRVMQLGFNAGQLSIFLEKNTLPEDRRDIIKEIVTENKMLKLKTYIDPVKQDLINKLYLNQSGGYNKYNKYTKQYYINYS